MSFYPLQNYKCFLYLSSIDISDLTSYRSVALSAKFAFVDMRLRKGNGGWRLPVRFGDVKDRMVE